MSEFIYHIYYRLGFKMHKEDGQCGHFEKEKSVMDTHIFDEGQLLDLENDDIGKEKDVADVNLEGIDVAV